MTLEIKNINERADPVFTEWSVLPSGHSPLLEPGRQMGVPMFGEDAEP